MKKNQSRLWTVPALIGGLVWCAGQSTAQEPVRMEPDDGVQVLTRGPVHEAFAHTVSYDPEPDLVVVKVPPEPIEEMPPDQKPEGANVTWIPGYWAWDDERDDFLWVSGIWRDLPPGRQWMSGYWARSDHGYQWTSGFWAEVDEKEMVYLPEPPDTVEAGPNMLAPSRDHVWVSGSWIWMDGRYVWRPGYWEQVQPDWVWVPAHYVSAPRGYVFVDGYWDHPVSRRGILFAPVHFEARIRTASGLRYVPATVINLDVFTDHLFLRPKYRHYYFGDYYAVNYHDAGYLPWFSFHTRRHGYDPIFVHQRWKHRHDRDWEHRIVTDFQHRRAHHDARPPRTWSVQFELNNNRERPREKSFGLAMSLERLSKNQDAPVRFQPVDLDERQNLAERAQAIRKFREERQRMETHVAPRSAEEPSKVSAPARVLVPRSPIVAKRGDELGRDRAPPKKQKSPEPDLKVKPKPKKVRKSPGQDKDESKDKRGD